MSKTDMNEQVVVAFFASADAADAGAKALMGWDKANDDIKLGTLGRLTQSDKGKLESKRYGNSRAGRGALIGGALGLLAAGVTGGLSLLGGAVAGGAVGGVGGKATKGSFGLTDASIEKIKGRLDAGHAALVVLCDDYEVKPTMAELESAGGEAEAFGVSSKVLEAIHQTDIDHEIEDTRTRDMYDAV